MNTIFPTLSIDRNIIKWEDYLWDMTPVEQKCSMFFKREDYFAPLGYGFVNGSKGRQCLWLFNEYNKTSNPVGVISGTSVHSPQHSFQSVLAKHFGFDSIHIIGATNPASAIKHENVSIASWFGAKFHIENIAYNPALQRRVTEMLKNDSRLKDYFYLEYGITLDHKKNSPQRVHDFHYVGSEQVKNIPDHIETLIIPAGSCNSATSILYGLARFRPKNLKDVHLIGIGPNKIDLIEERLDIIENVSGIYTKPFKRNYVHSKNIQEYYEGGIGNFFGDNVDYRYNLHHYDLHTTKYVDYQDTIPFSYEDITFHPRYEGKVMKYVTENLSHLINDKSMLWIVGSAPKKEIAYPLLNNLLGEYPSNIVEYDYNESGNRSLVNN